MFDIFYKAFEGESASDILHCNFCNNSNFEHYFKDITHPKVIKTSIFLNCQTDTPPK